MTMAAYYDKYVFLFQAVQISFQQLDAFFMTLCGYLRLQRLQTTFLIPSGGTNTAYSILFLLFTSLNSCNWIFVKFIEAFFFIDKSVTPNRSVKVLTWGPFHQNENACCKSTTVVNIVFSQILSLMSVSSKGVY